MRCSTPILFTCIAVLSRLIVKGGCICELRSVEANNRLLGGPRQTRNLQYRSVCYHIGIHEIKRTYLASRTHCLFIT